MKKSISMCMIVKNEENILEQCLQKVHRYVDEIIIVDTGSTDNTVQIAKKYTDKIYSFVWNDDYSAARNYSLSKASCDYILVLDADELIINEDFFDNFQKDRQINVCYCLAMHNFNCEQKKEYTFNDYRQSAVISSTSVKAGLFKNHDYYYDCTIHENLLDKNGNHPVYSDLLKLEVLHIRSIKTRDFKLEYYNRLSEQLLKQNPDTSNKSNIVLNLLHYYDKKTQYHQFDALYAQYSKSIFNNNAYRSYLSLIRKLYIKGHIGRALSLIESFRNYYQNNLDMVEIPQISDKPVNCNYFFINRKITRIEDWQNLIKEKISIDNEQLLILRLFTKKFSSFSLFLQCIELAFLMGVDMFVVNMDFNTAVETDNNVNMLHKFPIFCFFDININQNSDFIIEKLKYLKIKIGDIFLSIDMVNLSINEIKQFIIKNKYLVTNYLFYIDNEVLSGNKSSLSISAISGLQKKCNELLDFALYENIYLLFNQFPLCFFNNDPSKLIYLLENYLFLNFQIFCDYPDIESIDCNCLLKTHCHPRCFNILSHNEFKIFLKEIRTINELIYIKIYQKKMLNKQQ